MIDASLSLNAAIGERSGQGDTRSDRSWGVANLTSFWRGSNSKPKKQNFLNNMLLVRKLRYHTVLSPDLRSGLPIMGVR